MELFGFATSETGDVQAALSGDGRRARRRRWACSRRCSDLSVAIVTGDVAALAPGVGKKTAQRIVLELKDKVEQQDLSAAAAAARLHRRQGRRCAGEAQAALQALGLYRGGGGSRHQSGS